jgi:hypothetical protein
MTSFLSPEKYSENVFVMKSVNGLAILSFRVKVHLTLLLFMFIKWMTQELQTNDDDTKLKMRAAKFTHHFKRIVWEEISFTFYSRVEPS